MARIVCRQPAGITATVQPAQCTTTCAVHNMVSSGRDRRRAAPIATPRSQIPKRSNRGGPAYRRRHTPIPAGSTRHSDATRDDAFEGELDHPILADTGQSALTWKTVTSWQGWGWRPHLALCWAGTRRWRVRLSHPSVSFSCNLAGHRRGPPRARLRLRPEVADKSQHQRAWITACESCMNGSSGCQKRPQITNRGRSVWWNQVIVRVRCEHQSNPLPYAYR
jgi:hypothetical protein